MNKIFTRWGIYKVISSQTIEIGFYHTKETADIIAKTIPLSIVRRISYTIEL